MVMANVLLPLQAADWPQGVCPATFQEQLNQIAALLKAVLPGQAFYNFGPTKPGVEFQDYPWFRTTDGRWYYFSGVWRAPNNYDGNERRIFMGTEAQLAVYDGGDTGTPSPTTGPMWVVDTDFNGRSPIGVGDIPGTDPVKTLALDENYGDGQHTLTEVEGGVGSHTHAFGKVNPGNDDAYFSKVGARTVAGYTGFYISGDNGNLEPPLTQADLFTLPPGSDGAGVTPVPFSVVHPVKAVNIIKPSGRLFYTVP
jgi:hypothetical protein